MPGSIQKIAGTRRLIAKLKVRSNAAEQHYRGLRAPGTALDMPKESEVSGIEQLIRELIQDVLGSDNISPALWRPAHLFAVEIQKPFRTAADAAPFDQPTHDRAEAEYFRGMQLWCDHTDDFLDYLEGCQAAEEPVGPLPMTQQNSAQCASDGVSYDVAISFAGEDRLIAREIADGLRKAGRRVFYDEYEKASLWGRDLYAHLSNVYKNRARFCLIIISAKYASKLWTRHELRAAQSRAFSENCEYILPLRLDDTEIAGILPTTGYLHIRENRVEDIIAALEEKLAVP